MLLPIMGGYIFGGLLSGLLLTISYFYYRISRRRRLPWSLPLGFGWLVFLMGIDLLRSAQLTAQKNYSWQDGWGGGLIAIGLGFWWISTVIFLWSRKQTQQ